MGAEDGGERVKVPIKSELIESLIESSTKAINYSFQSEIWIRNNPHEHAHQLRQALMNVINELKQELEQATK